MVDFVSQQGQESTTVLLTLSRHDALLDHLAVLVDVVVAISQQL